MSVSTTRRALTVCPIARCERRKEGREVKRKREKERNNSKRVRDRGGRKEAARWKTLKADPAEVFEGWAEGGCHSPHLNRRSRDFPVGRLGGI